VETKPGGAVLAKPFPWTVTQG